MIFLNPSCDHTIAMLNFLQGEREKQILQCFLYAFKRQCGLRKLASPCFSLQFHPSDTPAPHHANLIIPHSSLLTEQRLCPGMSSSPPTRLLLILQVKQHLPVNTACGSLASAVEAGVLPLHSCYSACYSSCCTLLPALNCPHSFPGCAPHQIMRSLGQAPGFSSFP